jgi:hypothetical protein
MGTNHSLQGLNLRDQRGIRTTDVFLAKEDAEDRGHGGYVDCRFQRAKRLRRDERVEAGSEVGSLGHTGRSGLDSGDCGCKLLLFLATTQSRWTAIS